MIWIHPQRPQNYNMDKFCFPLILNLNSILFQWKMYTSCTVHNVDLSYLCIDLSCHPIPFCHFWTTVHSGGVLVRVIASNAVDHGFDPWSGPTKDYKSGICCFSAKHATLRRKSKDRLAWNQDNLSEWGDMSLRGLWFQWDSTTKIQLSVLV